MDYNRDGNVVQIITGGGGGADSWSSDQADWATEDEYRYWNGNEAGETTPSSNSNCERQQRSGSEPPNKKSRSSSQDGGNGGGGGGSNRAKAIGKMFFKTKLCCKFRVGTCPYVTNCNFAHSVEELRRPPANWQEIVAAHEEERNVLEQPREEFQIPTVGSSTFVGESMNNRSYKGRHCKKFYTEEGCPYGDSCTFLHDEQSKNRESVAISLGPGGYGGGGGGGGGGGSAGSGGVSGSGVVVVAAGAAAAGNGPNLKPSNWKTRICNKWEMTGYCPFGNKCHFAHGATELHRYGGGLMEGEIRDGVSVVASDAKQGVSSKNHADNVVASTPPIAHSDVYHIGVPSQRPSIVSQQPGQRAHHKWKGPDKISRIYGDWIDDFD
ncbi:zinc finger CCCH domain-containing protein 12 [Vicia villosa]|uniref:zinc finger CCCH domain-containing protein 12 n=1 Tax=Vicia villosa TaxID=3911 RepID=UPI00273AC609|nr:zinc finger CCCH domain-containing protein 12 [Vicia villosa]